LQAALKGSLSSGAVRRECRRPAGERLDSPRPQAAAAAAAPAAKRGRARGPWAARARGGGGRATGRVAAAAEPSGAARPVAKVCRA